MLRPHKGYVMLKGGIKNGSGGGGHKNEELHMALMALSLHLKQLPVKKNTLEG